MTGHLTILTCALEFVCLEFGAPAAGPALEDVRVMEKAVEERGYGRGIAEQLAPVVYGSVGGQEYRRALVPPHDHLQEIFRGGVWQLAHPEIVDDEEGGRERL